MKKTSNRFAKICFALSALIALAAVSIAAYTSLSSVKRVVTVKGTEQLFNSNILVPYEEENEIQTRIVSFVDTTEKKMVDIDVFNYIQGDITKFDNYGIDYTIAFELIDVMGNKISDTDIYSAYKINGDSMTVNPYTIAGNLAGRAASKNTYSIEIPEEYMSIYRIKVTAIPSDSKYSSIGRVIATSTEVFTPHWTGRFLDTEGAAANNGEKLGIINYQISGHMEEDCILSWDYSKVDIDPWFLQDMGIASSSVTEKSGRKEIKLHLGAENTPDQYNIKFYRTLSVNDVKDTWSSITNPETGYITFKNEITG